MFEVGSRHLYTWKRAKPTSGGSDQTSRQNAPGQVPVQVWPNHGFGRPHFAASGHRLSLVHCLVGPDVRWSVPGLRWLVWSGLWSSFAHVMQDTIICDFYLRIRCVFFLSELVLLKS